MELGRVHFEVFVRKTPGAPWSLDMAGEDREVVLAHARQIMKDGRVAAARVTKEVFDEETREFNAVVILKLGQADVAAKSRPQVESGALCVTPHDLYSIHARERIGRLLETWLERNHATPFELLHRPDLVEKLEASGVELQHAVQKIAIPEAHASGKSIHEMIRTFHALIERAVDRLMSDHRRGVLPNIDKEGFRATAERLANDLERGYLLGAGVAASIASAETWTDKITALLDLADAAPTQGPGRALALLTVQQPLAEILENKPGILDLLGKGRDLGENLAAMTRLAAHQTVERLMAVEPSVANVMPDLPPIAQRLATWLANPAFRETRTAVGRRILRELMGPRRLCPGDAEREIVVLRALAMSLTAASSNMMPIEEVQTAFTARSKMLVTGDFVEAYLGRDLSCREEAEALIWLTENVIGAANKRAACGWLKAVVGSLRFEKELAEPTDNHGARLAHLAALHRSVGRCGLVDEDCEPIQDMLSEMGGQVERNGKIAQTLARANAPVSNRLILLLRLAAGVSAPPGPAADRARIEAVKILRQAHTRIELAKQPESVREMRELLVQAGLAA